MYLGFEVSLVSESYWYLQLFVQGGSRKETEILMHAIITKGGHNINLYNCDKAGFQMTPWMCLVSFRSLSSGQFYARVKCATFFLCGYLSWGSELSEKSAREQHGVIRSAVRDMRLDTVLG